ncbi:MAG: PTS sugar transporter subunit IIA [Deltaproteobacteria bacterium]|nr:MAG: PTS sugar transporter subunit IIA [Deltaproteobacteria bacterium]
MNPRVGIVLIGHGNTATDLLDAARGILGPSALDGVIALDAGVGRTPELSAAVCEAVAREDEGRGVLILVDLLGASPCACATQEATGHDIRIVGGLNLAMLLKLASIDRSTSTLDALARAALDAGQRSVVELDGSAMQGDMTAR